MNMRDMPSIFELQMPFIESTEQLFARVAQEIGGDTDDDNLKDKRLHKRIKYRSVKISDPHIGTSSCLAHDLVDFFEHIHTQYLYLDGDFLDCWKMGGLDLFQILGQDSSQATVLQKTLKLWRHGTKIIFIPGNHDDELRKYIDSATPTDRFALLFEATHDTNDGRRILIMHGDSFDAIVRGNRALSIFGTQVYEYLANSSILIDKTRASHPDVDRFLKACGFNKEWSLAHAIRSASDGATYSASFEKAALGYLFKKNADICRWNKANPSEPPIKLYDEMICGHTHIPMKKQFPSPRGSSGEFLGPPTVTLSNTGCWVGRPGSETTNVGHSWRDKLPHPVCTAIVEHLDGRLEHIQWVPGVGIVPLVPNEDGTFRNLSLSEARERMGVIRPKAAAKSAAPV